MRSGGAARRFAAASLILLFALLPGLLAGRAIDAPAEPGEYARALQGLTVGRDEPARRGSAVARLYYGMWLPDDLAAPADADATRAHALLGRARLAQVVGLFAIGLLTYLTVMLAQGRARALLACVALCLLPAVHAEGHVLRPETPALLFSMLALLLLQGLPALQRPSVRRPAWSRNLSMALVCLTSGSATALAVAALPAYGVFLLVPGAALALAAGQAGLQLLRAARRRVWPRLPIRAAAERLWPWVLLAFASLSVTAWLLVEALELPVGAMPGTPSDLGLLPAPALLRWPLALLLGLGAMGWVLRLGLRLGRVGRLTPDGLLGVYCAVLLVHGLLQGGRVDTLPAAVAAAVLIGEGAVLAALVVAVRVLRRRA